MLNTPADIQAVALLDEPVRRALYEWVANADDAVSRDEAAVGVGVSRALAAFHLDRLVGAGLLAAEYRRRSGRAGPGAGRPAKHYRRGTREVGVSLPQRRYEVAALLFAQSIERLDQHLSVDTLQGAAREMGQWVGAAARKHAGRRPSQKRLREALLVILAERGYEPRETSGEIRLANCPFDAIVKDHRQLVCGMNQALADGLINGLGARDVAVRLEPEPGRCCLAIGSAAQG